MSELYETNPTFSNKLYHMFETYLKILVYGGNMFSNVATIQFPKVRGNNSRIEAMCTESCSATYHIKSATEILLNLKRVYLSFFRAYNNC